MSLKKINLERLEKTLPDTIDIKGIGLTRTVSLNDTPLTPDKSLKVGHYSTEGFNWGYSGSGPKQLALAICLEYTTKTVAVQVYKTFMDIVLTSLPANFVAKVQFKNIILRILREKLGEKLKPISLANVMTVEPLDIPEHVAYIGTKQKLSL